MYAICRPCLCVLFVVGCGAAQTEEKPGPQRAEYEQFIQSCIGNMPPGWFPGPKVPLKLIVTAIVGDDPQAHAKDPLNFDESRCGCQVATDGRVYHFEIGPSGAKGGGYPTIAAADQKRLDTLLSKLPDDGCRLPPFDRRLVLQVPEGDHCQAKVYDRADAPDEVCEILRLSLSRIRSWVLEFKSERDVNADGDRSEVRMLAATSSRQLVTAVANGLPDDALAHIRTPNGKRAVVLLKGNTMALWDFEGHRQYAKLDEHVRIREVAFSPDQSMVAISTGNDGGWEIDCIRIWNLATGELVHRLRPFEASCCQAVVGLQWTADGQYVLAATKADPMFSDSTIDIWSVKSGRHRGTLTDGLVQPTGVVLLPDGRHIAGGTGSGVRNMGPRRCTEADPGVRGFAGGTEGRKVKGIYGRKRSSRSPAS